MKPIYRFETVQSVDSLIPLMEACRKSRTAPADGMWESFRANATHWGIYRAEELVGYAQVDAQDQLLQFYLDPWTLVDSLDIFAGFLGESGVKNGIVGTHSPVFLSTAMHFAQRSSVHTYLFESYLETDVLERPGTLVPCSLDSLEVVVDFGHHSVGAPQVWLRSYFGDLIKQEALFVLTNEGKIIGTCEVRPNLTFPQCADIGMIVSPDFRRQGYGTYLLGRAKAIAVERGKQPICSCENGNTGSLRAIQANGFRSVHRLLGVRFSGTPI